MFYDDFISGRKYYFTYPVSPKSVDAEILKVLEDSYLCSIFMLLYDHPKLTRFCIADCIGKLGNTIYFHLKKFSSDVLAECRSGHVIYYSLTDSTGAVYEGIISNRKNVNK